jgi:hypothetical protein
MRTSSGGFRLYFCLIRLTVDRTDMKVTLHLQMYFNFFCRRYPKSCDLLINKVILFLIYPCLFEMNGYSF